MINIAKARVALDAMNGDVIALPREQVAELLAEVEMGQHARRALTNIKATVAIAASVSGAPA